MIKRRRLFASVILASLAVPSSAALYGYIDSSGRAHLSDVPLDSRYELFTKTPPAPPAETALAPSAEPELAPSLEQPTLFKSIPPKARDRYADLIAQVAAEQKIEPALLHAVVAVESAYNARARSPKGATGLMQLMPATAKQYGVTDLLNPAENLKAGARYLKHLQGMFGNNLRLVLAAYNAGEGAVIRSGRQIPPYRETRAYVPRVLEQYRYYRVHLSAL